MSYPVSKELLSKFIDSYFGYGNLDSPYWFIGKEEGGEKDLEGNFKRILAWGKFGTPTVDNIAYHQFLGFSEKQLATIQPTYTKIIQILLELEGRDSIDKEARKQYQRYEFSRADSNHCAIELMPMASRSTGLWLWEEVFYNYYGLKNRQNYFEQLASKRAKTLKELLKKHQPKLVVFYSTDAKYRLHWSDIAGSEKWNWEPFTKKHKFGWVQNNTTLFVITPHPTAHGLQVDDFPKIGRFIKERL